MKNGWWKIPAYCLVAGFVCFWLMVRVLGRFAMVTLPDGVITINSAISIVLSLIEFVAAVLIGGVWFCRKMTRRALLASATIAAAMYVLLGVVSQATNGTISMWYCVASEWCSAVGQLTNGLGPWPSAILQWLSPYVFVLFGRKTPRAEIQENGDASNE
ncbi:MAG: hypothetical protein PHS97_00895 [Oscillospiraceae bacterium]|nr:hypothetical protein [Oscillospiraceae bacterium]